MIYFHTKSVAPLMFNTNVYIFLQLYILGAVNSTLFLKVCHGSWVCVFILRICLCGVCVCVCACVITYYRSCGLIRAHQLQLVCAAYIRLAFCVCVCRFVMSCFLSALRIPAHVLPAQGFSLHSPWTYLHGVWILFTEEERVVCSCFY